MIDTFRRLGVWTGEERVPVHRFAGYLIPGAYRLGMGVWFGETLDAEAAVPTTGADLGCWNVPDRAP